MQSDRGSGDVRHGSKRRTQRPTPAQEVSQRQGSHRLVAPGLRRLEQGHLPGHTVHGGGHRGDPDIPGGTGGREFSSGHPHLGYLRNSHRYPEPEWAHDLQWVGTDPPDVGGQQGTRDPGLATVQRRALRCPALLRFHHRSLCLYHVQSSGRLSTYSYKKKLLFLLNTYTEYLYLAVGRVGERD